MPIGSQQHIQVLHVDDDPSFTNLTETFLEREDDRLSVETAVSADEGLRRINDPDRLRPPDCIVSDYDMPGRDGIEFLQAVREEHPELPFILFTGKGSEEVASDAISADVTDYLQKHPGTEQYELLANRIQNTVQTQHEKQRANRKDELMQLTEFLGDTGGFEIHTETSEVLMTDGCRRIAGFPDDATLSLQEAIGCYHPDDRVDVRCTISRVVETGEQTQNTWRLQTPDGDERLIDVTITPAAEDSHDDGETEADITTLRGAIHDVTDRREREQELTAERRLTEQSLNALDDLFYVLGTDGSLQRWNDQLTEITGYADSELAEMQAIECFVEEDRKTITDAIQQTLSGQEVTVEADLLTADDRRLPYEFTGAQLTDTDGNVIGAAGVGRDLTKRKEIEADIDWYQAIIRNLSEGIYVLDAEYEFQFVNYRVGDIEAISERDWTGRQLSSLAETGILSTGEVERVREAINCVVTDETNQTSIEVKPELPESTDVCELRLTSLDLNINKELILATTRDVTQRTQRRQEIQTLTRQYQVLLENFPGVVSLINEDLEYVRTRGTELSRIGFSPADVEGKKPHDLFAEKVADKIRHYCEEALSGVASTYEQEYDGERYRTQTVPIQTDNEETTQVMAVSQNITKESKNRQEIQRKNARLEEFTKIVSHELRSPLSVAEGYLELAVARDARSRESEHLVKAHNAIERSQALIEDLLTLAQAGEQLDELASIRLTDVAKGCWETVETAAATLTVDATHPNSQTQTQTQTQPPTIKIEADRSRLKQLFENLYRNAVEHGGDDVTVSVGICEDGFDVADTGSGIPESERDEIFEAGYSTNKEGTGFGLRIVKQVADAHGWDIHVTDSEQGGARFKFSGVRFVNR